MRHHVQQRKFGRVRKQRGAFLAGLVRALVLNDRIETTEARAKELRPFVEKLVTQARTDTPTQRRLINARLNNDPETTALLFTRVAPKYKDRDGGYTRITKLPPRASDAARMAIIEFV